MKKLFTHLFFAIALCLLSINSYAQDGINDATFKPGSGANKTVMTTAIQSDGKILIGGTFTSYNGTTKNYITRLNTDGSLDAEFKGTGANSTVGTITIQSDGKILIGGDFTSYNGTAKKYIARLNADGTLDASFTGTGANSFVQTIAIQSDGKILIGGNFTSYNGTAKKYLARLNKNGSLDASFIAGIGTNNAVFSIAIQSDGKILIVGAFRDFNNTTKNRIARLNTDGTLDAGFTGTGANNNISAIAIQSDGKIVIGGAFSSYNDTTKNCIARLNSDGSLDAGFTGTGTNNNVSAITIQSDEKILIGGNFNYYNGIKKNYIARLNTNGSLDADFTGTGVYGFFVSTIAMQSDGNIIIGGSFTSYSGVARENVARINNSSITGIVNNEQREDATGLSVFPNPSNGAFTIQLNKEETFSLYNSVGQIVRTIQLNQNTGNSATISGLEPGVYFLTGHSNTLLNYKIIVE